MSTKQQQNPIIKKSLKKNHLIPFRHFYMLLYPQKQTLCPPFYATQAVSKMLQRDFGYVCCNIILGIFFSKKVKL